MTNPVQRRRKIASSLLSLLGVIVVCVALNVLGKKINDLIGLPFYFDNVGTLMSALLGGYVPCITVGFLSNLISGLESSFSTYYCVISVFIAVAAVSFADKGKLTKMPHTLLAVLVFALIGGGMGGALTWLINGFDFGGGFASDFAVKINSVVPMGYFPSNLLSNFLIDFVDKLIVTFVSLLIYRLTPKRLIEFLRGHSWHFLSFVENVRNGISLRMKTTLLVVISTTLVASAAIGTSIVMYHNASVDKFAEEGDYASKLISRKINASKLESYISEGKNAEGYLEEEELLQTVREMSPDINYVYIYKIEENGTRVVFDLDTEDVKADEAGRLIEYDSTVEKYRDLFLAGEDIPVDIVDNRFGWILSVYEPIRDSSGKTLCHVGVDMSMDRLRSQEFAFLAKIISLFIGFLIVIRTYAVWIAEHFIIKPVNVLTKAVNSISYDSPEAREESLELMNSLGIHTGDEIENLYHAYRDTTVSTVNYIDEAQRKNEKINRLQNGLVLVLADMVESRDKCTGDHVRKTAAYTEIILRQMQKEGIYPETVTEDFINEVVNSAPLHDVGKISVPDSILNKPGKLTDEEFSAMKNHTTAGGKIIEKAISLVDEDSEYLNEARSLALSHHEKWNGKGYPTGLSGEEIPLSARVMAVADVFDALVSRRSYKEPFTVDKALDIIREGAGSHFDPQVAKAFLDAEDEVRRVAAMNMEL